MMPPPPGEMPRTLAELLAAVPRAALPELPAPWERQPTDTEESWLAFVAYRDAAPPRRLIRPGVGASGKVSAMYQAHAWGPRVEAFDRMVDIIKVAERVNLEKVTAKERASKHLRVLDDAIELCAIEINGLLESARKYAANGPAAGAIKPSDLNKLLELTIKYQRLIQGEATEIVGQAQDLSVLTDEELAAAEQMAEKVDAAAQVTNTKPLH